jgi:hypothetical protein
VHPMQDREEWFVIRAGFHPQDVPAATTRAGSWRAGKNDPLLPERICYG